MKLILMIGSGSFIGGICRYLLTLFIQNKFLSAFPFGTLSVNIIGCFLIGLVFGISEKGNISMDWRLFLATGVLGGFTTFSAFSLETINLIRNNQIFYALIYMGASVLLGLFATFIGLWICKII